MYFRYKVQLPMSNLLKTLGDDWHAPHPYLKLIQTVVPTSSNVEDIENYLTQVYVEEHYDYKLYKNPSKHTVYDHDIDRSEVLKKKVQEEMKRESETLEKLCKKMEELQQFLDGIEGYGEALEDDAEEEEEIVQAPRQEKGKQPKAQVLSGKEAVKAKKLEEQRQMKLAKSTKSSMATCQQRLLDLQEEAEKHDLLIRLYTGYRNADWYWQTIMKKIVANYSVSKDIETLIRDIDVGLTEYKRMRKRSAPNEPCKGEGEGLCQTHLLPLHTIRWSEKGVSIAFACNV